MKYTQVICKDRIRLEALRVQHDWTSCQGYSISSTWLMPSVDQITVLAIKLSRKQNETRRLMQKAILKMLGKCK